MRLLILDVWQPDCPVVYLSEKIEGIRLYAIDSHIENSNIRALLYISSDYENSLQTALNVIKKHSQVKNLRVLWKCQHEIYTELICNVTSAMHSLARDSVIFHRPLLTSNGFERWIVIVENKTKEKEVLSSLRENNEIRIKERLGFPPTSHGFWLITEPVFYVKLLSIADRVKLSPTQQKVFSAALEGGYYSYPRKTSLKQLSEKLGISKTAVAKNLRSVENKAIRVLAELIETAEEY